MLDDGSVVFKRQWRRVIVKHEKECERDPLAEPAIEFERKEDISQTQVYMGAKFAGRIEGAKENN
jgi:hypothetical protein